MKTIRLLLILFPLWVFARGTKNETFTNPVGDGTDPWLVKQGSDYFYCYTQNNAIYVSRSKQMTQQGESRAVLKAPETGWNKSCVWAPEIHFIGGRWFVYYAAGESGPPFIHQRTGILRSKKDVFSEYEAKQIFAFTKQDTVRRFAPADGPPRLSFSFI